jgi:hypothetical protein
MNMSTMFGQDLQQSVIQLGTALNDPIQGVGRLRRIGISFTEQQKEQIRVLMEQNDLYGAQRVILDELQVEIGGTARAVGEEYAGKVAQLKNAFGDLQEVMGAVMADRMEPMLPLMTRMIENLSNWIKKKQELKDAYEKLKEPMQEVNDLTRLELLQAEQTIAIDKLNNLEKQKSTIQTDAYAAAISRETGNTQEQINQLRKEIRARARLIENMQRAIKLRDEEGKKIIEGIEPKKEDEKWLDFLAEAEKAYAESLHFSGQALDDYIEMLQKKWESEKWLKESGDELIESTFNLSNQLDMELSRMGDLNKILDLHAIKIDTVKIKYDEWAQKVQWTMSNITSFISMAISAIDGVYSQMFQNRRIELDNWYEAEKDRIYATIEDEEERERALENLDRQADQKRRALARDEAKANKNIAIMNAIINTASAITKALAQGGFIFGPLMAAFIAAMGIKQIALIKAQPLPALAEGGELITNGPQYVLVGDNPGGRELVQATPLSSPNINGPNEMFRVVVNIGDGFYETLYDKITKATEDGAINIHIRSLRDW